MFAENATKMKRRLSALMDSDLAWAKER